MSLQFLSLVYKYKKSENLSSREEQRLLALMACHDLAAIGYLVHHTAALLASEELPAHIDGAQLLEGYGAIGRLLSGVANQAIGAIEELGSILEDGPRSSAAGEEFDSDLELTELPQEIDRRPTELSRAA